MASWYFLQINANRIVDSMTWELTEKTGLEIGAGPINVDFLPLPAVSITDLTIKGDSLAVKIPWCALRPNFFRLFRGEFLPAEVTLQNPDIKARCPVDLLKPEAVKKWLLEIFGNPSSGSSSYIASVFSSGSRIRLFQCSAQLSGLHDTAWKLDNFHGDFTLGGVKNMAGKLSFSGLYLVNKGKIAASARELALSGSMDLARPLKGSNAVNLSAKLGLGEVLPTAIFSLQYNSGIMRNFIKTALEGDLHLQNAWLPLELAADFDFDADKGKLFGRRLDWTLGDDGGTLAVEIFLPEKLTDFSMTGNFTARRLSLTQWLGFARNLAPGLQLSLDNILDVKMDFNLDAKSISAPKIEAMCNGSLFQGRGGVESFAKPVVFLDIHTQLTRLDLALGEAVARSPQPPWYGHAPLTPIPDNSPLKEGETGIDYDVNIGAAILDYGSVLVQNARLRIIPGKIDENGLEEVMLLGSGNFYDGSLEGKCILGGPASLPITITGEATGINGAKLSKHLPFLPFNKGKFNAKANVRSMGKELDVFLDNLKGNVKVSGLNVMIGKNLPLSRLDAGANFNGASRKGQRVNFNGSWNLACSNTDYKGDAVLQGDVWFDKNGASFKNLPFQASLSLKEADGFLPAGFSLNANGRASSQTLDNEIAISSATMESSGLAFNGQMNINYKKAAVSGSFSSKKLDMPRFFKTFGIKSQTLPDYLLPKSLDASFTANADTIALKKIRARLGSSRIEGSLSAMLSKKRPALEFELSADRFDFPKDGGGNFRKKLDFDVLRQFDAKGILKIGVLGGWNVTMANVDAPLQLKDGKLSIQTAKSKIYNGASNVSGSLNFADGLAFNLKVNVLGVNLGQAAKDQKLELLITGTGDFNANLHGKINSSAELPAALNGNCRFLATKGSWRSATKNGKPTFYDKIQASARIEKGRLDTTDFSLSGPGLQVSGKGYTNLVKRELDYTLSVNMRGVPDFPLYIYGPFDRPKTSIGAGKLILNALGSIPKGIGNLLGGLGRGIGNLLK